MLTELPARLQRGYVRSAASLRLKKCAHFARSVAPTSISIVGSAASTPFPRPKSTTLRKLTFSLMKIRSEQVSALAARAAARRVYRSIC